MITEQSLKAMALAGMIFSSAVDVSSDDTKSDAEYFEGQWAFTEEACGAPTNWTLLKGGYFISQDLTGTWEWADDKLTLSLIDLATDEETGEQGGKFQMEGPVELKNAEAFSFTIKPDIYEMKRCG